MTISQDTRAAIEQVWPAILDAVATCELTLEGAALKLAKVGVRSVQRYARETPGARKELDDALLDGAELSIARIPQMVIEMPDARRARVLAEYLWKIAASRDPQRFGQNSRVDLNVKTVDLTRIIQDANARLQQARAPALIEHSTGKVIEDAALSAMLGSIDLAPVQPSDASST